MSTRKLIYFCGSMRAGRQDVDLYGQLVEKLQRLFNLPRSKVDG